MGKVCGGMIFLFLNFNIDLPWSVVGLIPSFVGYCLILAGLTRLTGYSRRFVKIRPVVMAALVYSAIQYVLDLTGATLLFAEDPRRIILTLVSTVFSLLVSYNIIMGIKDIELTCGHDLESRHLYYAWKVWAVYSLALFVVFLLPMFTALLIIIAFIFAIYLLSKFNRTSSLFYAHNLAARVGPRPASAGVMILLFVALVIGCTGAIVYGRRVIMYRAVSSCGQLQVSYHRVTGVFTYSSLLSNQAQNQRALSNPVFIWSPCGRYLAVNSDSSWGVVGRQYRQAEIICPMGIMRGITPAWEIQERYGEAQVLGSSIHDNIVEVEKWLDSENVLFNFIWSHFPGPYIYYSHVYGWFIWHVPTYTITELVVTHP